MLPCDANTGNRRSDCTLALSPRAWENTRSKDRMVTNGLIHDTKDVNEVLAELRQAGQDPDQALLDRVKALGPAAVRPLIEMATDESLHTAETESPEVWAPFHAIQLLGGLEATEAVEPLLPLLAWDDQGLDQPLPECLGRIGRPALPPLRAYLFDRSH